MEYSEYISQHNARREREQQLANQYNQKPEGLKVKNLWMHSVEKQTNHDITPADVGWTIVGLIGCATVIILSIWL